LTYSTAEKQNIVGTTRSLEDETRNGERNQIEILNGGEILSN